MIDIVKVIINNKQEIIPDNITVLELIKYKNLKGMSSVWINDRHLLLSEYENFSIKEDDVIKIITVVGGG